MKTTKEQAELGAKRMLRVNRLSALAAQLGGEKEFVCGKENYFIKFHAGDKWVIKANMFASNVGCVYMTKECAEQICDLLNKGLFSLNGGE